MTHLSQISKHDASVNATNDNTSTIDNQGIVYSPASDATLIANGYEPIVLAGKVPQAAQWQKRPNTIAALTAERAQFPAALGTGLRTGRLVPADIDLTIPEHAAAIEQVIYAALGDTLLKRVGKKGMALCYRNETPLQKITISGTHGTLTEEWKGGTRPLAGKVEILGTGNQVAAYGIHPDTGRPYEWPNAEWGAAEPLTVALADLPEVTPTMLRECAERIRDALTGLGYDGCVVSEAGATVTKAATAAPDVVLDSPDAIARATGLLRAMVARGDVAIEGSGGNNRTYQVCAEMLDLGLSPEKALEVLAPWNERCLPPWDDLDLGVIMANAAKYAQNEAGCSATGTAEDAFGQAAAFREAMAQSAVAAADKEPEDEPEEADESWGALVARFRGHTPAAGANMKPITFLDAEKTLPLTDDGAVLLWAGPWSAAKTALAMSILIGRIKAHLDDPGQVAAVRVAYCIGEDLHGFMRQRVPAVAAHFGIPLDVLGRFWRTVEVPTLDQKRDVKAFCAAQATAFDGQAPTVLVVDTFATAAGAVDENSAEIGKLLLKNGAVGHLKRKLGGPLVIVIDHTGKAEGRDARGHSSKGGNADGYCQIEFNKETRVLLRHVKKLRMAEDGFTLEYRVSPPGGVPIVTLVGRVDRKAGTATSGDRDSVLTVSAALRWFAGWRKDRATTRELYLAECRTDTWTADPDHSNPDTVLAAPMSEKEAAGWNAGRQRLAALAAAQEKAFGTKRLVSRRLGERSATWLPNELPGVDLDN